MNDEEVDLILKSIAQGFDQTQAELDKTQKGLDELDQSAKKTNVRMGEAKTGLSKYASGLNEAVEGLTGFNLGQLTAAGGLVLIANQAKKAVSETVAYAKSVRDLAQNLGISTENASRLIQVSDDYGIELGVLERASKMALQNGFTPTVETLAEMADKYVAIQDPQQRAAELSKVFGKTWEELTPMLKMGGDAIREGAANIQDSMIMTEEAAQKARDYEIAVDGLTDSWKSFQYEAGNEAIPVLIDIINILNNSIVPMERFWKNLNLILFHGSSLDKEQQKQADHLEYLNSQYRRADTVSQDYTAALEDQAAKTKIVADWEAKLADQSNATSDAIMVQKQKMRELANSGSYAAEVLAGLRNAQKRLADAQDSWNQSTAQDSVNALDKTNKHYDRYLIGLSIIDEVFDTHTRMQEEYNRAIQKAGEEYQKTGDMNAYYQALQNIKTTFGEQASPILEAKADVEKYTAALAAIPKSVETDIITHHIDVYETQGTGASKARPNASGEGHKGVDEEFAMGGSFQAGTRALINENPATRPETVVFTRPGYVLTRQDAQAAVSGGGISVGDINVIAAPGMDENSLANLVVKKLFAAIKREKATGARYSTG